MFRSHLRLLRGYFLIVGTTFIAYSLPVAVFFAYVLHFTDDLDLLMNIQYFSGAFATLNNCMNPFVYFYCQSAFKDCLKKLIRQYLTEKDRSGLLGPTVNTNLL